MSLTRSLLFLLIFTVHLTNQATIIRFRTVHCESSGKSLKVIFCFIKTFSRKIFTLNIGLEAVRNMTSIMVNFDLFILFSSVNSLLGKFHLFFKFDALIYRDSGKSFQRILNFENIDWCKIYNTAKEIQFFKLFLDDLVMRTSAAVFLEICNKVGDFKAHNISVSNLPFFGPFPNGDYFISFKAYNDIDDLIMNVTATLRLTHK